MFSGLLNAPCELQLHLLQTVIFLYPTNRPVDRNNTELPPAQTDSLVRGLVELYTPSPRHISGIKVKLRAIQTVAILDANTGVIPVSWEDQVLMEKEVYIGMQPKGKKDKERGRAERGRTPGPSQPSSRRPSLERSGDSLLSSRQASRAPSRDVTARNSVDTARGGEEPNHHIDNHEHDSHNLATQIGSAFARAVSRGRPLRPQSRPNSRPSSRSRPSSPSGERRNLNGSHLANSQRSTSAAASIIAPSPMISPREERPRPSLTPSSSRGRFSDDLDVGSLSIAPPAEQGRTSSRASPLGHPDDDDFGLSRDPPPFSRNNSDSSNPQTPPAGLSSARQSFSGPSSRSGLAKRKDQQSTGRNGSAPPNAGQNGPRSQSKGWARWGRSVSRARGSGQRDTSVASHSHGESREEEHHPAEGIQLEKGVHGFEFAFIIPADSPEYTRSPFGRVRYVIKATAYGAGRAKSNLESWRDCFPVANPSMEGGPTPLTVLYNDLHPTVGLLSIACTSQNISVGGLFQLDIHSPTPPPDLFVYMVRVCVDTTIELQTKRKGKQVVPTQRHKLFEKGYVPPSKNDPHGEGDGKKSEGYVRDPTRHGAESAWTVQGLARMPDDNSIRSSTIGGTRAAIRFSHVLIVEVVHSREPAPGSERRLKVFTLRQPITLPSCCVAFDAATLPAYTADDDDPSRMTIGGLPYDLAHAPDGGARRMSAAQQGGSHGGNESSHGSNSGTATPHRPSTAMPLRGQGHEYCVCGLSLQDLEVRERSMVPVSGNDDIPINNLRRHGKIGEFPLSRTRSQSTTRTRRRSSVSSQRSATLAGGSSSGGSNNNSRQRRGSNNTILLERSISRSSGRRRNSNNSSRGRSPSIHAQHERKRSSSLARSRTRELEFTGGDGIVRHTSRSSSRLRNEGQQPQQQQQPSGMEPLTMVTSTDQPPSYTTILKEVHEEAVDTDDDGEVQEIRGRR
ncbi:unnamed protein product [Sympodiomycopsis kandeliae]